MEETKMNLHESYNLTVVKKNEDGHCLEFRIDSSSRGLTAEEMKAIGLAVCCGLGVDHCLEISPAPYKAEVTGPWGVQKIALVEEAADEKGKYIRVTATDLAANLGFHDELLKQVKEQINPKQIKCRP